MLKIIPIPAHKDNYIWAICNTENTQVAMVDPGDAAPVIEYLEANNLKLSKILVTHHHWDHTGGITALTERYNVAVLKTDNLDLNIPIDLTEQNLTLNVMAIPGHTLDHIAFYNQEILFCGDTLFTGGCGKIFEGTVAQMFTSVQKLKNLSTKTKVYCGHEYTENNLRFAMLVEPDNKVLRQRQTDTIQMRQNNLPTVPSTLELELATNPFLRTDQPAVRAAAVKYCGRDLINEADVFSELRAWKNSI